MKFRTSIYAFASLALAVACAGCESEKDLIIIEGNLPIKTTTLYMVGNATPNGWSIDAPTPFAATGEDPLVFSWEGNLNPGEMKLCLTTGSWDVGFIRPLSNGEQIGKESIVDAAFQMHAGDPDEKWRITEAGVYSLVFNLRDWTMSSTWLRGQDAPPIEPILADALYIVGDATPGGWNIGNPTVLEKKSDYVFEYEGPLTAGELKACTATGSWDVSFVRPASDGVIIDRSGVAEPGFVYTAAPDDKWHVADAGIYRLVFDLEHFTIAAEYLGEIIPDTTPIESPTLYMIGDATPGGWSMDHATAFTVSPGNKYVFTWEGELVEGLMKACLEPDPNFSCPFLRPTANGCAIGPDGVEAPDFVYTTGPDDQWRVTAAGRYSITFDLEHYTISARYLGAGGGDEKLPLESATLFMIGDATPNGWSMDNATEFAVSSDNKYVFTWQGTLAEGSMKACLEKTPDFSCPFLRPAVNGCTIGPDGVEASEFVYTKDPDDQWRVTAAGRYSITFDLEHYTVSARYLGAGGGDEKLPLESATLFMIGDATPNGWSMDNATEFAVSSDNKYVFTWQGTLAEGSMKACLEKTPDFSCPFLRPAVNGCTIGPDGVEASDFVYTKDPDDQWRVEKAGRYSITFNLKNWTIEAKYLD